MNGPFTFTAAAFALVAGFSITNTTFDLVSDHPPTALTLELLRYNGDGTVTQRLSGDLAASWVARITRIEDGLNRKLCAGAGDAQAIYTGVDSTWTVNDWVGDECPPLQSGDILAAAWTYTNEFGYLVTTTGSFVVGEVTE